MNNRAAIIAIGTEVTSGEIANANPQWLAQKLEQVGIEAVLHLAVPDDEALMLQALQFAASHADFIFTTGGLGPTSDDFTRDVVAKWLGVKLVFNAQEFEKLKSRLEQNGRTVYEGHRRQCSFPEQAELNLNKVGSAHGFSIKQEDKCITVLPGPPMEIESIWVGGLSEFLKAYGCKLKRLLFTWTCKNASESELAEKVEQALSGSGFDIGYRASKSEVIIKVWVPRSQLHERDQWFSKLEGVIGSSCKQGRA